MKTTPLSAFDEVRQALRLFQEGYTRRRTEEIESFMTLFDPEAEIELIGTGGVAPGDEEWCLSRRSVQQLIEDDWNYWGDVRIDVDNAHIHVQGDAAWLSAPGTVTRQLAPNQSYQNFLDHVRWSLKEDSDLTSEQRLLEILRRASETLYETQKGAEYIWPFRFSAVLLKSPGQIIKGAGTRWRFHQVHFSFPSTQFPDVRWTSRPD
jgi:hypothetical protein